MSDIQSFLRMKLAKNRFPSPSEGQDMFFEIMP